MAPKRKHPSDPRGLVYRIPSSHKDIQGVLRVMAGVAETSTVTASGGCLLVKDFVVPLTPVPLPGEEGIKLSFDAEDNSVCVTAEDAMTVGYVLTKVAAAVSQGTDRPPRAAGNVRLRKVVKDPDWGLTVSSDSQEIDPAFGEGSLFLAPSLVSEKIRALAQSAVRAVDPMVSHACTHALLHGPPGTGKSTAGFTVAGLIAEKVGTVNLFLREPGTPSLPDLLSYLRVVKSLRPGYREKAAVATVVILDELDRQVTRQDMEGDQIHALKTALDGLAADNVLVIATTNESPEHFMLGADRDDGSLIRTGRLAPIPFNHITRYDAERICERYERSGLPRRDVVPRVLTPEEALPSRCTLSDLVRAIRARKSVKAVRDMTGLGA